MKRILTLEQLVNAAYDKRSVINKDHIGMLHKPMPATFLMCMPGWTVARTLLMGVYLYVKKPKQQRKTFFQQQVEGRMKKKG